jgi:hypothetical protein
MIQRVPHLLQSYFHTGAGNRSDLGDTVRVTRFDSPHSGQVMTQLSWTATAAPSERKGRPTVPSSYLGGLWILPGWRDGRYRGPPNRRTGAICTVGTTIPYVGGGGQGRSCARRQLIYTLAT